MQQLGNIFLELLQKTVSEEEETYASNRVQ